MHALGAVLLAVGVLALAACTPGHEQSTFDTTGPIARSQLTLFYWIFWAAVFVFVVVEGILLYAAIKYRRRPGDGDPPQTHGNKPLEIGWTVAPAIVLAIVAVPSVATIFDNANIPENASLNVEVVGHQWWWEFNYPDLGLKTSNELHIPKDEVVAVQLLSKDVIHSFWIPKIAGKLDMVPNSPNDMWLMGEKSGEFAGQCAEFCGESHANMRFRVIVEPRAEFDAWVAAQMAPAAIPVEPLAAEGLALFEGDAQCWACHKVEGSKRARANIGPNLTHVASRTHLASGIMDNTQENTRRWLEDNCKVKPGNFMCTGARIYQDPDHALKESEVSALVAYLRSLK